MGNPRADGAPASPRSSVGVRLWPDDVCQATVQLADRDAGGGVRMREARRPFETTIARWPDVRERVLEPYGVESAQLFHGLLKGQ